MHEVIPSVNCMPGDADCVKEHISLAGGFKGCGWVHLDVADGAFTFHKTWNDPSAWKGFGSDLSLEVHLMIERPEEGVEAWIAAGAKRLIVHTEVLTEVSWKHIVEICKKNSVQVLLGMNPETDPRDVGVHFPGSDGFLVLGVHPGLSGQRFLPLVLKKISVLRESCPDAIIETDGGIDAENGAALVQAGADILVSASAIFRDQSPEKAYRTLVSL